MENLFDDQDMTGLAASIRDGDVSAREVVEFSISRLAERNPAVNAVVSERAEAALAEVDAGLPDGPLRGIPFLIKDLHADVAGLPTSNGSRLFAGRVAQRDTELVARYRRAGLVVIGKTNTPEFGQNASTEPVLFGPTRNPRRLTHGVGGSSGGAAAAVAVGIAPAAHASDGGGSIRIPASANGLVGLKPSRGRMPSGSPLAGPLSVEHAVTRSVRDTALLLDLTCGPAVGAPFGIAPPARPYVQEVGADPGRLRIGITTVMPNGEPVHPDCAAVASDVGVLLEKLGHSVETAAPVFHPDALAAAMQYLMSAPMAVEIDQRLAELGRELRDDDLETMARVQYDRCKSDSATDLAFAYTELERTARDIGRFFTEYDLLLTPSLGAPTPPLGLLDAMNLEAMWKHAGIYGALTSPFNSGGQPAISLPLGKDSTGLPLGAQLVAAHGREDLLIRIASQLEAAYPWNTAPVWPAVQD
ncbi:amidase [Rhodococcus sp. AG1013]|uniref:amidase n=1 Tax=unclassified Rhodococcus (in: high G+C Gram-positive bacteria) TaxID=192944 RepID=UPI000E0A6139|nr:amidase [Rhodococcus sp. AG1013]RDI24897.1 amidase [Rhodococcus sp. AG1013]